MRQLAGDAWSELVGWDGKLAQTVRVLFRHPGELTRAVLEGRRLQYVSPVRLYLTCSVLYFLVAAATPVPSQTDNFEVSAGIGFGSGEGIPTPEEAAFEKAVINGLATLSAEERAAAEREIASQPSIFQPMLRALAVDYAGLRRRITQTMPRAFFVLIPALAGILALLHRRRPYPDHLYFALHVQAFVFLSGVLVAASQFSRWIPVMATVQMAVAACVAVYVVVAQRRVYGGTWLASVLKALAASVLYGVLWGVTSIAVTLWASRSS